MIAEIAFNRLQEIKILQKELKKEAAMLKQILAKEGSPPDLTQRNKEIYQQYKIGLSIDGIASNFKLSPVRVREIIRRAVKLFEK